jgi:hypothetical protein
LAKGITSYDQPHMLTINVLYTLSTFGLAQRNSFSRLALGGWQVGWIGRYASGMPISSPASQNNIAALLFQSTVMNRVPGQPLYLKDLNDHQAWDPKKDFVLNPAAWADPAPGEWGTAASRYSDFRYRRIMSEQIGLSKQFRINERMSLNVRFELFNMFNRMLLPNPDSSNPLSIQRRSSTGETLSGYGYINAFNTGGQRSGQLTARFRF